MTVNLLHYSPLWLTANAIRMSHDNHELSDSCLVPEGCIGCYALRGDGTCDEGVEDTCYSFKSKPLICKTGEKDKALIDRVGNKLRHESVLEMAVVWLEIDGISRACLAETSRHRLQSQTVRSTRYTLAKGLKNEEPFLSSLENSGLLGGFGVFAEEAVQRASKYIVLTGDSNVDYASLMSLELLRRNVQLGISNDKAKYSLPESIKVKLQTQFNMRSLKNFLKLRTEPSALWEIRELASKIFEALPEEYKFLVEDVMYDNPSRN